MALSISSFNCSTPLEEGQWIKQYEKGIPYNVFFPKGFFKSGAKFPMVLFLHGAGERGNDNEKQLIHIAPILSSQEVQEKFPAVLVFPQCPESDYWANVNREDGIWTPDSSEYPTKAMGKVIDLIDMLDNLENIDTSRMYLAGLSMGGFGSFDLLSRRPNYFAAAVTICGGADLDKVSLYSELPLWNFHGVQDPVVPVSLSRDAVRALRKQGSEVIYTEYEDGEHDIWTRAFENPELIPWIFKQKK